MAVPEGAAFVPRLFTELGMPIRSVTVHRPTLDDVFLAHTGSTIRDMESTGAGSAMFAAMARRGR